MIKATMKYGWHDASFIFTDLNEAASFMNVALEHYIPDPTDKYKEPLHFEIEKAEAEEETENA